ncbi:MAG TPA: CshA/CshB family fibrillar adhesin-related protein, partial [Microbacterium sp.]|nr:CshA/CshB family fibrillar adhesin-related protein [Microbacterium sp.]
MTSTSSTTTRGQMMRRRAASMLCVAVLACIGLFASTVPASATYAEGGDGQYLGAIDWMEWGADGAAIAEGAVSTSTRVIGGQSLTTSCTITGVSGSVMAYRSGNYRGDAIDNLYNIGGQGTANQMVYGLANRTNGATVGFHFACETTLDGRPVPLGGLVVADAESSNKSQGEYVQADPDETTATWRIIERARNCSTNVLATLQPSGSMRMQPDAEQCATRQADGFGAIAIGYMEGATGATVQMKGGGRA